MKGTHAHAVRINIASCSVFPFDKNSTKVHTELRNIPRIKREEYEHYHANKFYNVICTALYYQFTEKNIHKRNKRDKKEVVIVIIVLSKF